MAINENNKILLFYLHLQETSLNISEINIYLILEFKIYAF